jgi:hypothetical protein
VSSTWKDFWTHAIHSIQKHIVSSSAHMHNFNTFFRQKHPLLPQCLSGQPCKYEKWIPWPQKPIRPGFNTVACLLHGDHSRKLDFENFQHNFDSCKASLGNLMHYGILGPKETKMAALESALIPVAVPFSNTYPPINQHFLPQQGSHLTLTHVLYPNKAHF